MKYLMLFLFILYLSASCVSSNNLSKGKKIVKEKCFGCHAPQISLEGMPLDSMYLTIGEDKLQQFLINEIDYSKKHKEKHPLIKLSKREIKSIMIYLEEYKNGVY